MSRKCQLQSIPLHQSSGHEVAYLFGEDDMEPLLSLVPTMFFGTGFFNWLRPELELVDLDVILGAVFFAGDVVDFLAGLEGNFLVGLCDFPLFLVA